jgi:hypothetical protein
MTAALALIIFGGCATAPDIKKPGEVYIGMMPEESSVLFKLNVAENRELARDIYELVNEAAELPPQFWNRTSDVYAGIAPSTMVLPELSVVAVGDYPPAIIKNSLNQSEGWDLQKDEYYYFLNPSSRLQLAVPDNTLVCLSNHNVQVMIERYERRAVHRLPEEVRREFDISDMVLYIPKPGSEVGETSLPLQERELPISSLWVTLVRLGGEYEVSLVFRVENEKRGKQVAMLSRLLLVAWMRKTDVGDVSSLKEEVTVEATGNHVRIRGLRLDRKEILKAVDSTL